MNHIALFMGLTSLLALNYSACCRSLPPQPSRPAAVEGWGDKVDPETDLRFHGVLLLKAGESSDNGKIGVRVKDIVEAERCGHVGIEYHRRATLQFFRPADGQVLCEEVVTSQGAVVVRCGEAFGVSVAASRGINTEEGWVLFDLRY